MPDAQLLFQLAGDVEAGVVSRADLRQYCEGGEDFREMMARIARWERGLPLHDAPPTRDPSAPPPGALSVRQRKNRGSPPTSPATAPTAPRDASGGGTAARPVAPSPRRARGIHAMLKK